jgi:hypothetical protein
MYCTRNQTMPARFQRTMDAMAKDMGIDQMFRVLALDGR